MDGPAPSVHSRGTGATASTEFWVTNAHAGGQFRQRRSDGHASRGACRRRRTARSSAWSSTRRIRQRVAALRAPDASHDAKSEGYVRDFKNARHPGFHKTDSIDYAIVLSGEIYALMDEGEVLLKAGDVLIQRGTSHAWSNRTEQPCCVAFVLIDAEPV